MLDKIKLNSNTIVTFTGNGFIVKQYNEFDNTVNMVVLTKEDLINLINSLEMRNIK